MRYVRAWVDDIEIDLGEKSLSVPITYQIVDVKDISKRIGSTTKTVVVPRTKINDKVMGVAFDITAENQFDKFSFHKVRFEENSTLIFDGFMQITDVDVDTISFFCFKDISKLKNLFGDKMINDLNLSDLEHVFDENIFGTWYGFYPEGVSPDYFYPIIDYGRFQNLTPGTGEDPPDILFTDMYPAMYLRRLILQMCIDSGYTLSTSFFDNEITGNMLIPFTNEEFVHDKIGGIEINGLQAFGISEQEISSVGSIVINSLNESFDPLNQWDGDEYTAANNQTVLWQQSINVRFPTSSYIFNDPAIFLVQVDRGSGYLTIEEHSIERPNQRFLFQGTFQNVISLNTGDKLRFVFNLNESGTFYVKSTGLTIDPSAGGKTIEYGEFVQLAPNLPPMKQVDLFRSCYQMFNWIVSIDDEKGEIFLETFDDFFSQKKEIDMSGKLVLNPKPKIQYKPLGYAKKYDFQYTHDEKDFHLNRANTTQTNLGGLKYGDGKLYFDESGDAALIGKIAFSPTIISKSFQGGGNYIDLACMLDDAEPTIKNTSKYQRILINAGLIDISKISNTYSSLRVEGIGPAITQIPFVYFQKRIYNDDIDLIDYNLSFDTPSGAGETLATLKDKYYLKPLQSVLVSAQVTAYFLLNSKDVSEIDFTIPWIVDYFGSTFRVNKIIDYLPGSVAPTKVELIKFAVVNPYKQVYEKFS